jgi:peroxiredoxin
MRSLLWLVAAVALASCGQDDRGLDALSCGEGTYRHEGQCLPRDNTQCGPDTVLRDGECVSDLLEPGRFRSPLVKQWALHGVGSHTDELRLRDDGVLFNCSYTFNIINAATPSRLRLISGGHVHDIEGASRLPGCKHLAWDDDFVFTTHLGSIRNDAFLSGWDVSDLGNPVQIQVLQEEGISYEGIDVAGGNIFVGLRGDGLGIYNYDPDDGFERIGELGGFHNAWSVAARGDYAYVADGVGGFVVVDASDPTDPERLGSVAVGGQARYVVVDGDYAYVAASSGGVAIVDISDPDDPTLVGRATMPGTALRVAYSDDRIFVAAWNDMRVYDVTDRTAPEFVAAVRIPRDFEYGDPDRELPTHRIFGVAAKGQDVFIGAWEHPYSYRLEPDRLAPNIRLPETAARIDISAVEVGETKTVSIPITNQGTAPLTIVDTWVSDDAFTASPRQARIAPGDTLSLDVSFSASSDDEVIGYLHIVSDDPVAQLRRVYLVGNADGVTIGAPLPPTTADMLDGETWNSSDSLGKVTLITYYATFCPVCANHLPDLEERFWIPYAGQGLEVIALNPRESGDQIGQIQDYIDTIRVSFPAGVEDPADTYSQIVANFAGPNPFPVDVIVDKQGIVRFAAHEYDPDLMKEIIEELLAE